MANLDGTPIQPIAIASAPPGVASTTLNGDGDSPSSATMSFTCLACARRKIKCDKALPVCSSCRKGKMECVYQAPPPRRRKRKLSGELADKLAQYEQILSKHGLLPEADQGDTEKEEPGPVRPSFKELDSFKPGRLMSREGKSRYLDSNFWRHLGDEELQRMSDDEDDEEQQMRPQIQASAEFYADPLTAAFIPTYQNLLNFHPPHNEAMALWRVHSENVEPLCKILHGPTVSSWLETVSQQPAQATRADECLLFAIYHFAVFSMAPEQCEARFGQTRSTLAQRYDFACRQAFVNANFLKTTEITVMQALTLYLLSCRNSYDPHVFWILTGAANRIARRMGLHRDAESLGLPPFEVQMRRRLFYQAVPLDGMAGQMAGIGSPWSVMADGWDTNPPLNIDDTDIWPGMTETPKEQPGATEMIYCLTRACLGRFALCGGDMKDYDLAQPIIDKAEREVEEQYIRYCDVINPLHFLTIGLARSAVNAMRLRSRLPNGWSHNTTPTITKEALQLAQKILDTDAAAYANLSVRKYMWHVSGFFAWGSWDSLIFILTSLSKTTVLSPAEIDGAWSRIEAMYNNHFSQLLESRRAVQIAMGRLALRAWKSNPPRNNVPEPAYITTLRSSRKVNPEIRKARPGGNSGGGIDAQSDSNSSVSPSNDANAIFFSLTEGHELQLDNDFTLDTADWMFWDQLIKDYQGGGRQAMGDGMMQPGGMM